MSVTAASPADVVRAFVAAWNANDIDSVVGYLHPEVRYHNVPLEPIFGREPVRHYLRSIGTFDWVDWQLLAIAESGNQVLTERVDRFSLRGHEVSLPLMGIFEVEQGLIRGWRDYFDLAGYRRQLGNTPAVEAGA